MKAINLYDMVAVGEAPEKIMYSDSYYEYHKSVHDYYCSGEGWLFENLDDLNEEVENIEDTPKELEEENKTLKELNVCVGCDNNSDYKSRINEVIDDLQDTLEINKHIKIGNNELVQLDIDHIKYLIDKLRGE